MDVDLSSNLSLRTFTKVHNISSGYLSSLFKKEVGVSLTNYVTQKLVKHAYYLLMTTDFQI